MCVCVCSVREIVDAFAFFDREWRLQDLQDEHVFEFTDALTRTCLIQNTQLVRREQRHGTECEMKIKNAMRIAIDGNIVDEISAYI